MLYTGGIAFAPDGIMNNGKPKYQQVSDEIEIDLRGGKMDGPRMPSVRGVANQYGVSIVTASRALQVLRDEGVIQQVERSGTFRLPVPTAERWAVVFRLTPGPLRAAVEAMTRAGFEAFARRHPMHFHFDAFKFDDALTPADATRAARAAAAEGIHGLFFLPSRASAAAAQVDAAFLAGCREAGLPVVLLERNLRGQESNPAYDLVCLDDLHATIDATRHLIESGRKRIALVVASPTTTHNDRAAGYLFALHQARKRPTTLPEHLIWLPDELPSERVAVHLAERVINNKIDAVICYHDYIAIALIMELLRRGRRVPQDVAVSGFDNIDAAGLFGIRLTTVENPVESMAEQAIRLMRSRRAEPERQPVRVIVPTRLLVRQSTDESAVDTRVYHRAGDEP